MVENLVRIWNQDINLSQGRVDTVSIARKRLCKKKLLDLKKILEWVTQSMRVKFQRMIIRRILQLLSLMRKWWRPLLKLKSVSMLQIMMLPGCGVRFGNFAVTTILFLQRNCFLPKKQKTSVLFNGFFLVVSWKLWELVRFVLKPRKHGRGTSGAAPAYDTVARESVRVCIFFFSQICTNSAWFAPMQLDLCRISFNSRQTGLIRLESGHIGPYRPAADTVDIGRKWPKQAKIGLEYGWKSRNLPSSFFFLWIKAS